MTNDWLEEKNYHSYYNSDIYNNCSGIRSPLFQKRYEGVDHDHTRVAKDESS